MSNVATLQIEFPKDLLALLGAQPKAAETAKEFVILGLYQESRISGGKAAELLGLTRRGFVSLLARKGMDYFRLTPDEWAEEVSSAKQGAATMPEIVSNTGPLIALAGIGQFDLLHQLFDKIIIPSAARAEIRDETSMSSS